MPAAVWLGHFCSRSQPKTSNGIFAEIQYGPVAGEQTLGIPQRCRRTIHHAIRCVDKVPGPVSIQSIADERVIKAISSY